MIKLKSSGDEPSTYSVALLLGLGAADKHVYGGTVPDRVKQNRRRRNRAARRSRRINH